MCRSRRVNSILVMTHISLETVDGSFGATACLLGLLLLLVMAALPLLEWFGDLRQRRP